MTGATIIVKSKSGYFEDHYYMIKVRHTGMDVLDIIPGLMENKFDGPEQLLLEYLNIRQKNFTDLGLADELEASRKKLILHFNFCFEEGYSWHKMSHRNSMFVDLLEHATKVIEYKNDRNEKEFEEYLCGYDDHCVFIDWDDGKAYDNGKLIGQTNKEMHKAIREAIKAAHKVLQTDTSGSMTSFFEAKDAAKKVLGDFVAAGGSLEDLQNGAQDIKEPADRLGIIAAVKELLCGHF